jgi:hypothetical protein
VLVSHDTSFFSLGLEFDPRAEYAGCRICGKVYQSALDRQVLFHVQAGHLQIEVQPITHETYLVGDEEYVTLYGRAHERRQRWRELHRRRYHSDDEVTRFSSTGLALTPEAAHKLAPYGFAPVGNLHADVVDAMASAPRSPEEDAED